MSQWHTLPNRGSVTARLARGAFQNRFDNALILQSFFAGGVWLPIVLDAIRHMIRYSLLSVPSRARRMSMKKSEDRTRRAEISSKIISRINPTVRALLVVGPFWQGIQRGF
jgi:hypothetical protein